MSNIANNSKQNDLKISIGNPSQIAEGDTSIVNQAQAQIKREERQKKINEQQKKNLSNVKSKVDKKTISTFGIKEGQTTATGLEKAIFIAGDAIIKAQFAVDGIFYGKFEGKSGNKFKQALDNGIINLLDDISDIDLCQILNYAIGQIPGSKPFDPEVVPQNPLGFAKYKIQKAAYDTQVKIDNFHANYLDTGNEESKAKGVYEIIKEIQDAFKEISDPEAQSALRDPRLTEAFPQIGPVNSFLEKAFNDFNRYTDYRQIPSSDIQKLITTVDKIRAYSILIQGLNTPANAISFADSVFPNANIQELIQKIQKVIDPARLMPLLKNIVESLKKIQSVCNVFVSFVSFGQAIIKIATLLIKVLKILIKFLKKLPIPNVFTVVGITITFSGFCEDTLKRLTALQDRLNQINILLSLCVSLFRQLSVILYDIIAKINKMLVSLESCSNADPTIIKDLQDARDGLQKTADYFTSFVKNYDDKKTTDSATFGDYTIQIVTEEVTDDAITLRRRYGIAMATNGTIVAQSDPTFASDNQIIINEVKFQLASKGFVKSDIAGLTPAELNTISESLSFVMDDDINLADIENINYDNDLDSPENEDENSGVGLNAFMNKLQGGKKLRQRMRKMMIKNNIELSKDLKAQDPTGKYTKNIISEKEKETTKLKIQELESEKNKLILAAALNPNPVFKAATTVKIKQIQDQINNLKKQAQ
jgi:hypothetical protein